MEYATKIGDTSLNECIEKLKKWEQNPDFPSTIHLHKDYAPYSFGFTQMYENGTTGIVGGLLYHGNPDHSGAVQMVRKEGWQTHT